MIELGPGVAPAWLVAQLCVAWPHASVLLVARRKRELKLFETDLEEVRVRHALPQIPIRMYPFEALKSGITLTTWTSYDTVPFRGFDFVIVLDATQVEHEKAQLYFFKFDSRLGVFGFLNSSKPLAPRTEAYMTAAFGPTVLEIPRHGFAKPQIQVAWITINRGQFQVRDATPQTVFRSGIEQHRHRNQKIVRIAKALAAGDANDLKQFPRIYQWWSDNGCGELRVLVACASESQARALHKLAGTGKILVDETVIQDQPETSWWAGPGIRFSVNSRKHSAKGFAVVINAAGGVAPSHLRMSLCDARNRRRLLVIDFKDRHLPQLRRLGKMCKAWWERRQDWYRDHRIYDLGISEIQGQLDSFIRQFHTKATT